MSDLPQVFGMLQPRPAASPLNVASPLADRSLRRSARLVAASAPDLYLKWTLPLSSRHVVRSLYRGVLTIEGVGPGTQVLAVDAADGSVLYTLSERTFGLTRHPADGNGQRWSVNAPDGDSSELEGDPEFWWEDNGAGTLLGLLTTGYGEEARLVEVDSLTGRSRVRWAAADDDFLRNSHVEILAWGATPGWAALVVLWDSTEPVCVQVRTPSGRIKDRTFRQLSARLGRRASIDPQRMGYLVIPAYEDTENSGVLLGVEPDEVHGWNTVWMQHLHTGWGDTPVLAGDLVAVTDRDGIVHAYDRGSGQHRWSADVTGVSWTRLITGHGQLLVVGNGRTVELDSATGAPLRSMPAGVQCLPHHRAGERMLWSWKHEPRIVELRDPVTWEVLASHRFADAGVQPVDDGVIAHYKDRVEFWTART